jgi:small-conductance mechanosensitive channel
MDETIKSILLRFARGFISGAVASMAVVVPVSTGDWSSLLTYLNMLGLAISFGGITGLILAIDKWIRMEK